MSWVRVKEDGTKVTTPTWVVIPCILIGTATPLALIWVLLIEHGSRRWGLSIATLYLAAAATRVLFMCEKHERTDRSTFGQAKFTDDRSDAARAGLSGD